MAVRANFDNQDYLNITGYKISCCFQAENGIQDAFYVYIEQVISPQNDFEPVDMNSPTSREDPKRGDLIITDNNRFRNYTFSNIDLVDYQIHFSHFRKIRLLTFRYDPMITNEGSFAKLDNSQTTKPVNDYNNRFAQKYTYSVAGGGFSESLLSISSKFSRSGKEFIRFGTQRTKDNSFMKLAMDLDAERKNGITPKTITYKGLSTSIDTNNFDALIVDETYGSFLPYGLPSLDTIARVTRYPDLLHIHYNPLTPFQYLQHVEAPPTEGGIIDNMFASSIETAVLVLKPGIFLNHSKSMV